MKLREEKKQQQQLCAPTPAPLLPSLPFDEELEVRDRLATAKAMAGVGDDIRWDLMIEEAAKMSCGLRGGPELLPCKKAVHSDDEDRRSTSASGGDDATGGESDETEPELEASSNDESDQPDAAAGVFGAKLPPWRRSGKVAPEDQGPDVSADGNTATTLAPWRRSAAKHECPKPVDRVDCDRVYSITMLLQCWSLMQQNLPEQHLPDATSAVPPAPLAAKQRGKQQKNGQKRTDLTDAPWRRARPVSKLTQSACTDGSD
jgi:hypothetical protein